jgi:hypothetical protein
MRSDEEVERHLEEWLEEAAQPMPHEVLEGALEAVARTPQVGARGSARWLDSRPMTILTAAAVLLLIAVAGSLAVDRIGSLLPDPSTSARPTRVWDPAADWRSPPSQENPSADSYGNSGVWSYMRSQDARHEPVRYYLLPGFRVVDSNAQEWSERDYVNLFVARSESQGAIAMHPWSSGPEVTDRRNAILAWRSPITGSLTLRGHIAANATECPEDHPDGFTFFIDQWAQTIHAVTLSLGQSAALDLSLTVTAGDSLYFILDAGANAWCDSALLTLRIADE